MNDEKQRIKIVLSPFAPSAALRASLPARANRKETAGIKLGANYF
jgi:hypothetical protein